MKKSEIPAHFGFARGGGNLLLTSSSSLASMNIIWNFPISITFVLSSPNWLFTRGR